MARIASASRGSGGALSAGGAPAGARSGGTRTLWPASSRVEISARLPDDPHFALADDLVEMRLRELREATAEPAVEAHARLVLADRIIGDAALAAHVKLRIGARPAHSDSAPSITEPTT